MRSFFLAPPVGSEISGLARRASRRQLLRHAVASLLQRVGSWLADRSAPAAPLPRPRLSPGHGGIGAQLSQNTSRRRGAEPVNSRLIYPTGSFTPANTGRVVGVELPPRRLDRVTKAARASLSASRRRPRRARDLRPQCAVNARSPRRARGPSAWPPRQAPAPQAGALIWPQFHRRAERTIRTPAPPRALNRNGCRLR